jgi:serine/threonine protein kinase
MAYLKEANSEPLPGYRLVEPLGKGGFGEVWKCEVPGGLFKAIKFVYGNLNNLNQAVQANLELQAFERIKAVRHPFVLSLERSEIVNGQLIIVSELADKNLEDRMREYQEEGRVGIPREELLDYLLDAAEALDLLNFSYDLQHLDIKPANLFLVGNHVKIADFGLVQSLEELTAEKGSQLKGGMTPLYTSPEMLMGKGSRHCDQYSLAIVYMKLLTDALPFNGKNVRQVMMQHLMEPPDLEPLPVGDQPFIERALSKEPEKRFSSCQEFLHALALRQMPVPAAGSALRRSSRFLPILKDLTKSTPVTPDDVPVAQSPPRVTAPMSTYTPSSRKKTPVTPPGLGQRTTQTLRSALSRTKLLATDVPPEAPENAVSFRLPDYEMLQCLGHGVLGELWKVRSTNGQLYLARLLHNQGKDGEVVEQYCRNMEQLNHLAIPKFTLAEAEDRLVLMLPYDRLTLLDRFHQCAQKGKPGIPREEMLETLAHTAVALDEILQEFQVAHTGLSPLSLLLDDHDVRFTDFGLLPFYWLALGGSPADSNPRYAAPEVLEGKCSPRCDQYSLALIYAEMVSGYHPRPQRSSIQQRSAKIDLTFLSSKDQQAVEKALDPDPSRRYANCREFVSALGYHFSNRRRNQPPVQWPSVAFLRQLKQGLPFAVEAGLPEWKPYLQDFLFQATQVQSLHATRSCQYLEFAGQVLVSQVPIRVHDTIIGDRVRQFAAHWKCRAQQPQPNQYRFVVQKPGNSWNWLTGGSPALEVQLDLQPPSSQPNLFLGALITIRPLGNPKAGSAEMVYRLGADLIEGLCLLLQVNREQRQHVRLPYSGQVTLIPINEDDQLGPPVSAVARDISLGGILFHAAKPLNTSCTYVILDPEPRPDSVALLAQILRAEPVPQGCDIRAKFLDMPTSFAEMKKSALSQSAGPTAQPKSVFELVL